MKKTPIKIIKRDARTHVVPPPDPTAEEILVKEQKEKAEDDRDMASNIKTWISERRVNRTAEELDAKDSLFAWDDGDPVKPA